jgi:hypothetical protein
MISPVTSVCSLKLRLSPIRHQDVGDRYLATRCGHWGAKVDVVKDPLIRLMELRWPDPVAVT